MAKLIKIFKKGDTYIVVDENDIPINSELQDILNGKTDKVQNNFEATTDPTENDDITEGYSVGSKWYNTIDEEAFICVDTTEGAAKWINITLTADELGSMAFEDTDDYYTNTEVDTELDKKVDLAVVEGSAAHIIRDDGWVKAISSGTGRLDIQLLGLHGSDLIMNGSMTVLIEERNHPAKKFLINGRFNGTSNEWSYAKAVMQGSNDDIIDVTFGVRGGEATIGFGTTGRAWDTTRVVVKDIISSNTVMQIMTGLNIVLTTNAITSQITSDGEPKQEKLVSGTNIKTINGNTILGSGNIEISGGGAGGLGFHYDNINHKLQNKTALQTKLNDNSSFTPFVYDDYVYFRNNSDGNKLYKIHINGTNETKLNDNSSSTLFVYDDYIYFINNSDGFTLYKIHINGTNETKLNDNNSSTPFVYDDYVYFRNNSDGFKLYKIHINGTNETKLNDNNSITPFVYDDYVYFRNESDGNKLYKIHINGTNETKLNDNSSSTPFVYDDYIYFINNSDGFTLYKIHINGTDETKLNDSDSTTPFVYDDYVYFRNNSDGNKLYSSEISNIIYFTENDNKYESEIIENNSQEIYIKAYQNIPLGTDYTFSLANEKVEDIVIPEGDMDIFLMLDMLDYMGGTYNLEELFNIGDIITLYKTGESDIQVEISNISPGGLQFTTDTGQFGDSWGIKALTQNYEVIPNTSLNGTTIIDLEDLFGTTTNELYYKIELESDETKTKTPIINIIELTK